MSRAIPTRRAFMGSVTALLLGVSGCLDNTTDLGNDNGTEDNNGNMTNSDNSTNEPEDGSSFLIGMPVNGEEKEPVLSVEDDAPDFSTIHYVAQEVIQTAGTISEGISEEEVERFNELTRDVEYYEDVSQPGYHMKYETEVVSFHTETEAEMMG